MNEAKLKAVQDQLDKVFDEMYALERMISSGDAEKERISMLVSGDPMLWQKKPELYEQMAPLADENKPPFTSESWLIYLRSYPKKDPRLTYTQIEEMKTMNPNAPWDALKIGG